MKKPTMAEGEEILKELRPVFLSFFWRYFIFLFIFIWTAVVAYGVYVNAPQIDAALNLAVAPTIEVDEINDTNATDSLNLTGLTEVTFSGVVHDDKRVRAVQYRIIPEGESEDSVNWSYIIKESDKKCLEDTECIKKGITEWTFTLNLTTLANGSNIIQIRAFDGFDYKSDDYNGNQKYEYKYAQYYVNKTSSSISLNVKGEAPLSTKELIQKKVYESVEGAMTIGGGVAGFWLLMLGGYKVNMKRAKSDEEKPSLVKQVFYTLLGTAILAGAGAGFIALTIWLIGLIVLGLIIGVIMTRMWPVITYFLIAVIGAAIWWKLVIEEGVRLIQGADGIEILVLYSLGMSILGCIMVEFDRMKTRYYITNKGLIMMNGFLKVEERTIRYSNISDINFEKGIIGRIFDFGNIIPVSKGGMGTGSASSFAAVGAQAEGAGVMLGGGKSRTTAVAETTTSLFGVKDPEGVKKLILDEIERPERERRAREEEGLELQRKMAEKLEKLEASQESEEAPKGEG